MPVLTGPQLAKVFGLRDPQARQTIQALYHTAQQSDAEPAYAHWLAAYQVRHGGELPKLEPQHFGPQAKPLISDGNGWRWLFATETYYALICHQLAAQIVTSALEESVDGRPLASNSADWPSYLARLVCGEILHEHGIVLSGQATDYAWYLSSATETLFDQLAQTVTRLSMYRLPLPDGQSELLNTLYRALVPTRIRQTLGEYYTPSWLANHTLNRLNYLGDPRIRLLDPACGSGVFLVLAIHRLRQHYAPAEPTPEVITQCVTGFDIQPLAVLSAQTAYLHAISPALRHESGPLHIPVHCMDSILDEYHGPPFDVVAGNPPWVNWERLPKAYRQATQPFWQDYGLFPHRGFATLLGQGKKDLAMLMTYRALDRFVKDNGRLGFIISRSVFTTASAGQGFRRFQLGDNTPFKIVHIDDMSALRPFEGISAPVSVMIAQKGIPTTYPVSYTIWHSRSHPEEANAQPVDPRDPTSPWIHGQAGLLGAASKLLYPSDYQAMSGACTWLNGVYWLEILQCRADNQLWARNSPENSKKPIRPVTHLFEGNLVFPLLRARDIRRWRARPQRAILIPQNPETRRGYDTDWLRKHYPNVYAYLSSFKEELVARAGYRRYYRSEAPFYSIFNLSQATFAPFKVVWKRMSNQMTATVAETLDGKPIVPQETLTFVACETADEAHYLCALLNSGPVDAVVRACNHATSRSFGTPGMLAHLQIKTYDPGNDHHRRLAELSWAAHQAAQGDVPDPTLAEIEAEIDQQAAHLWHLTSGELALLQALVKPEDTPS